MSNYAKLYWLTRLDSINSLVLSIVCILILIAVARFLRAYIFLDFDWDEADKEKEQRLAKAMAKKLVPYAIIFSVILCFIPTKDEAVLIIVGGKTMNFVESDTSINNIPAQTTALITEYLDKQLKEIKK